MKVLLNEIGEYAKISSVGFGTKVTWVTNINQATLFADNEVPKFKCVAAVRAYEVRKVYLGVKNEMDDK